MNQKELRELIEFLIEKDIAEFELERGDVKVRIKRATEMHGAQVHYGNSPAPAGTIPPGEPPAGPGVLGDVTAVGQGDEAFHIVKSPIVGTFYDSPSPGAPPFVRPGDTVETGQVLCIIEAMKLMNEIEADVAGEVVKRLVNNGQPVEYGQSLFTIRPR